MSTYARLFFVVVLFFYSTVSAQEFPLSRAEPCKSVELFQEARRIAGTIPVTHSDNLVTFSQTIRHARSSSLRSYSDYAVRKVPVVFLNTMTCELVTTSVTRKIIGGKAPTLLSTDDGRFIVFVEERPQGTLWNWWNTPLQVLFPEYWVVAGVHWKRYPSGESVVYTPGSSDIMNAFPTLVEIGRDHIRTDTPQAYEILKGVRSRAIHGHTVPEVIETYFPRLIESIISIEHADDHEVAMYRDGKYGINPIDRPFAVIGANPERAYSITRSPVGAQGLMQIMPKICRETRPLYGYPVPVNCSTDSHSHPTELAAAMIIIDDHLSALMQRLRRPNESRDEFCRRPELKLMLRASYNTGPGRVSTAVKTRKDWSSKLLNETKGYLVKAFGLD